MTIAVDHSRTNQVRLAAQQLRTALGASEETRTRAIREAKEWLISAADQHETDAARVRQRFLAEPAAAQAEQTTADVMSVVISDLYVANTLMAAGQAVEETGAPSAPHLLDEALVGIQQAAGLDRLRVRAHSTATRQDTHMVSIFRWR